jgi:HSP20 family protein
MIKDIIPMRGKTGSDYNSLSSLQRQVSGLWDRFFPDWDFSPSAFYEAPFPALNVVEGEKNIAIDAELPGVNEKDIKIEVRNNQIIIQGEKSDEVEEGSKGETYYLKEISRGAFLRTIFLSFEPDPDQIEASFDKGMLHVTIEKPKETLEQPKTIPIRSSSH